MILYAAGRRLGKTDACVRWLLEQPGQRTLIVPNAQMREHVLYYVKTLYLQDLRWSELVDKGFVRMLEESVVVAQPELIRLRGRQTEVGIDDLEEVLQTMFGPHRLSFAATNATVIGPGFKPTVVEG